MPEQRYSLDSITLEIYGDEDDVDRARDNLEGRHDRPIWLGEFPSGDCMSLPVQL